MPKDPNELGALWENQSARGPYMTGTINGQKVVVFRNTHKQPGEKSPDWRVLKSKPKEARGDDGGDFPPADGMDVPF